MLSLNSDNVLLNCTFSLESTFLQFQSHTVCQLNHKSQLAGSFPLFSLLKERRKEATAEREKNSLIKANMAQCQRCWELLIPPFSPYPLMTPHSTPQKQAVPQDISSAQPGSLCTDTWRAWIPSVASGAASAAACPFQGNTKTSLSTWPHLP